MKPTEHEWTAPRFITPEQLDQPTSADETYTPPQEFAPEETEPEPMAEPLVSVPARPPRRRWGRKLFGVSLALLLASVVGSELYRLLEWSFALHPVAGGLVSALLAVAGGGLALQIRRSFKGLKQLKASADLKQEAEQLATSTGQGQAARFLSRLQQHYRTHPDAEQILQQTHEVDSSYSDAEVVHFLSRHALGKQDAQARRCIQRHSVEAGMLVAVSPWASFDMLLAGWRNLRMLNEIMSIYGIAPGASAQIKLVRSVLHNIAFAGLSDLAMDAGSTLLGTSLTSGLSARAGQGLGAGLFTARTGLMAMELCRPLPAAGKKQTLMKQISGDLLKNLTRSGS